MIRTQVYIPETIHQTITALAKQRGISMAELIRRFLVQGVEKAKKKKKNDLYKLADLNIHGGPVDLSEKMDAYLYGKK